MRALRAVLAAALLAAVLVFAPGQAAFAKECRDGVTPEPPQVGLAGLLTATPAQPSNGDPFTDHNIPIHHVYGTSWNWTTHDLRGITPADCTSTAESAMYEFNSGSGNLMLSLAGGFIGVLDVLERLARESSVDWFASWIGTVTAAVGPIIMGGSGSVSGWQVGLLPLALIVAGIVVAFRARRADMSDAFRASVVALVCVALAGAVFSVPGQMSRAVDSTVTTTADVAGGAFNSSLTDAVNRNALYTAWLAGAFGNAYSQAAKDHGPALFDATHYKWVEQAEIDRDPAARARIDTAKTAKFTQVAEAVEKEDPQAYAWMQGKGERTGTALFALIALALMGWFALVAFVTILVARVMMQVLVVAAPVAAVAGLLPKGGSTLRRMLNLFVAALFAVFKFTLAAGMMAVALGLLSALPPVTALIFMTILTVAALTVLKPIKSFKTVVPGLDPNRSYFRELVDAIKGVAVTGASAATGGAAGVAVGAAGAAAGGPQGQRERVDLVRMPDRPPEPPPALSQARSRVELVANPAAAARPELAGPQSAPVMAALPAGAPPDAPGGPGLPGRAGRAALTAVPETPPARETPTRADAPARADVPARVPAPAVLPAPPVHSHSSTTAVHSHSSTQAVVAGPVHTGGPITTGGHTSQDPRNVVIAGEIVNDTGTYRRPEPAPAHVTIPDLSHVRDKGTDQPAGEIVLYQSKKELTRV